MSLITRSLSVGTTAAATSLLWLSIAFAQSGGCSTDHNGAQDIWEEGVDCGGPCKNSCACFDGALSNGEDAVDCGGVCTKPCP